MLEKIIQMRPLAGKNIVHDTAGGYPPVAPQKREGTAMTACAASPIR